MLLPRLRRAVKAAGLTAGAAVAAIALLEERRRRKLALPGLISSLGRNSVGCGSGRTSVSNVGRTSSPCL